MSTPPTPRTRSASLLDRRWRTTTIGMVAIMSLISFVYLAVATAMPTAAAELDGIPLYGLAFGGAFAASVLCTVIAGVWNDSRGPKWPMWTGIGLFTLGLIIAGAAITMPMLIAGRVVQGFGGGLIGVTTYIVVAQVYPEELRPKVFASFATAWVVPAVIGPSITGFVVDHLDWRWVFLSVPVLALPAALLMRETVNRTTSTDQPVRPDASRLIWWAAAAAAAAGVLQLAGQQTGATAVLLTIPAIITLVLAVPRLLPPGTFTGMRGLPTVVALRGLASAAFAGTEVFVPLLLTEQRSLSPIVVGIGVSLGACSWALGSWWQGRDQLTWDRVQLIRRGTGSLVTGVVLVTLLVVAEVPVLIGFIGWLLCGLGMGLVYPALSALALDLSEVSTRGHNTAALKLSETLFTTVLLTITASLFAALLPLGGTTGYLVCFALPLVLALVAVGASARVIPAET